MQMYRKGSHTAYDIITKYRKSVLQDLAAERCRKLIRQVCKESEAEIIKGHVSKAYIYLLVSCSLLPSVRKFVQSVKDKSSRKLLLKDKNLNKENSAWKI
jgi:REP element-mobilizing transposase RayT